MKNSWLIFFFSAAAGAGPLQDIQDASLTAQVAADSTAIMVDTKDLKKTADGYALDWQTVNWCPNHAFRGQRKLRGSTCTTFLISPTELATAGHCLRGKSCANELSFVFGLKSEKPTARPNDVYKCKAVESMKIPNATGKYKYDDDVAVITLDRPVASRNFLRLEMARGNGSTADLDDLQSVGYPDGLPVKASAGKRLSSPTDSDEDGVATSAQIIGGMSGGPIVSRKTGRVVGINTTGRHAYEDRQRGCRDFGRSNLPEAQQASRDHDNYFEGSGFIPTAAVAQSLQRTSGSSGDLTNFAPSITGAKPAATAR